MDSRTSHIILHFKNVLSVHIHYCIWTIESACHGPSLVLRFLTETALNLRIQLKRIDIFIYLRLLLQEMAGFFHLFKSSLKSALVRQSYGNQWLPISSWHTKHQRFISRPCDVLAAIWLWFCSTCFLHSRTQTEGSTLSGSLLSSQLVAVVEPRDDLGGLCPGAAHITNHHGPVWIAWPTPRGGDGRCHPLTGRPGHSRGQW